MKTVLCYGDSNTYGYNPVDGTRFPENIRWPGRLKSLLGENYRVIEEGCNGRTTIYDDPVEGWKNGLSYLRPCLNSHKPVDILILMLGSNDLKEYFHNDAMDIARGAGELVKVIQSFTSEKQGYVAEVILVSPPELGENIRTSPFYGSFTEATVEVSKRFPECYRTVADELNCVYFNAAEYIKPSKEDSLHLTPDAHEKLANELCRVVKQMYADVM